MTTYAEASRVQKASSAPALEAGVPANSAVQSQLTSSLNARVPVQRQAVQNQRLNQGPRGTMQRKLAETLASRMSAGVAQRATTMSEQQKQSPAQCCGEEKLMQQKTESPRAIAAPGKDWTDSEHEPPVQRAGDDIENFSAKKSSDSAGAKTLAALEDNQLQVGTGAAQYATVAQLVADSGDERLET